MKETVFTATVKQDGKSFTATVNGSEWRDFDTQQEAEQWVAASITAQHRKSE